MAGTHVRPSAAASGLLCLPPPNSLPRLLAGARLGLCMCPGKHSGRGARQFRRSLSKDVAHLHEAHRVTAVACLLNDAELRVSVPHACTCFVCAAHARTTDGGMVWGYWATRLRQGRPALRSAEPTIAACTLRALPRCPCTHCTPLKCVLACSDVCPSQTSLPSPQPPQSLRVPLPALEAALARSGMALLRLPMIEMAPPDSMDAAVAFVQLLVERLEAGCSVAMHCK